MILKKENFANPVTLADLKRGWQTRTAVEVEKNVFIENQGCQMVYFQTKKSQLG
jgi:hypothetical protein